MRECTSGVSQSCVQPLSLSWKPQMLLPTQYSPALLLHHYPELYILFLGIPLPLVVPLWEVKYGLGGVCRSDKYSKAHTLCCPALDLGAFRSIGGRTAASSHPKSSAVLCGSTATEKLPHPSSQRRKMGTYEITPLGPSPGNSGHGRASSPVKRGQRRNADVSACTLVRGTSRATHTHQVEALENCFAVLKLSAIFIPYDASTVMSGRSREVFAC